MAPASPLRDLVVPGAVERKEAADAEASECAGEHSKAQHYIPWAELLKWVFGDDVLRCPHCRGRRHMISVIMDPEAVRRVLESVRGGLRRKKAPPPEPGILMPARQGRLGFET